MIARCIVFGVGLILLPHHHPFAAFVLIVVALI